MKHRKTLGSLILAVAALSVLSGSAWATTLTSPTGTVATPTIKAESEGHISIGNPIASIQCNWSFEGTVSYHSAGNVAMLPLTSITPSNCTNAWHVTVGAVGALTIEWTSGYQGTVRSTGLTLDTTRLGITCTYLTNNTKIGTITGGSPATLHLEGALPIHSGSSGLCGSQPHALTGSYKVTSPTSLFVDKDGTTLTSPTGIVATPTVKASNEGGHVVFVSVVSNIGCSFSFEGTAEGAVIGKPAGVSLTNVSILGCTGGSHVTVPNPGRLEIEWTSGYNGTIFWTGGTIEWTGGQNLCNYATQRTEIGTITGGSPATIHLSGALPVESAGALCLNRSEPTPIEGDLVVTAPSSVFVDPTS